MRGRSAAIADEGGIARGSLSERKGEHGQALGLSNLGSGQHPRDRGSFSDPSTFSLTPSHLELACVETPSFLLPKLAIHAPITTDHFPTSREQGRPDRLACALCTALQAEAPSCSSMGIMTDAAMELVEADRHACLNQ